MTRRDDRPDPHASPAPDRAGRPGVPGGGRGAVALGAVLLLAAGCDDLLSTSPDPNTVPADELDNPTSFEARLVGTQADFFFAYDMAVAYGGLFTDELVDGTGFDDVDERRVTPDNQTIGAVDEAPEGLDGLWTPMQRAAFTSSLLQQDILDGNFPEQVPDPENSPELATVSMLAGYSSMSLGEMFCTTAFGGTGPELSSAETWALAEDHFTRAIDAANATEDVRFASLVGRARARILQGNTSGALSDADQVPLDWSFVADVYSTNSQQEENDLWNMLTDSQRFSVDPAYRDLTIDDSGTEDPRVNAFQDPNDQFAIDGSTELYQLEKYVVATAPIRLASGFEAAYYVAEIQGGQEAVDAINDVRAEQGISEEFDSSDEEEIRLKLFDERARTLFLEGKRMGDLRRYIDSFGLDLFPTGPNFGDQTCMPLPDAERDNNPDI